MRKGIFGATALKQSPAVPKMLPDHDDNDDDADYEHNAKFNAEIGEKLEGR